MMLIRKLNGHKDQLKVETPLEAQCWEVLNKGFWKGKMRKNLSLQYTHLSVIREIFLPYKVPGELTPVR